MKEIKKKLRPSNPQLKKIGLKLKAQRKNLGYKNSDDFAYDANMNRSQYGKYEGGTSDMRISSLIRTLGLLGTTPAEFFSDFDDTEKPMSAEGIRK